MITGLSHVSIVVPSLDAAARELDAKYGLKIGAIKVNAEQGVRMAYVDLGNAKIELMEPSRADSPVAKFLERNPRGGIHHFSLGVGSIDTATAAMKGKGVRGKFTRRYARGTNVVVLDPDVARAFPNAASVNQSLRALRDLVRLQKRPRVVAVEK